MRKSNVSNEIRVLFEQNELNDLKRFMNKRECLNSSNMVLIYLFYLVQSAGILTTTIAAGYNEKYLVWVGVGLNVIASFINISEKINMDDFPSLNDPSKLLSSLGNPSEEGGIQNLLKFVIDEVQGAFKDNNLNENDLVNEAQDIMGKFKNMSGF